MKTEIKNSILFYFASFIISLLSVFLIWIQTSKYGINLSPDSTVYMKWSQNILDNGIKFIITNNDANWPPLYPIIVAVFSKTLNLDPVIFARHLNCCLIFFCCLFTIALLKRISQKFSIIFGFFIPWSIPFNFVFSFAWSEPLFIFILLLIIFSLKKTDYKHMILCGCLTSFAILTRYAGVTIVMTVCLYIFIQKIELAAKIKKCFCYAFIPTSTYIIYLARNYYFSKTLMGPRSTSNTGLISNCNRAFSTVTSWFNGSYSFLFAFLLLVLGAYLYIILVRHNMNFTSLIHSCVKLPETVKFSFCFILVYSVFIIISSTTTAYNLIDDRLMAPIFPFALIIAHFIFSYCNILTTPNSNNRFLFNILSGLSLLILLASIVNTLRDTNYRKSHGIYGYHSTFWQENELVSYLKNQDIIQPADTVFSNDPFALFLVDRKIDAARILNLRYSDFERSFLIFFNIPSSLSYSYTEHKKYCEIEKVTETKDGILYKVGKCKR